jgi:hypothetical protein
VSLLVLSSAAPAAAAPVGRRVSSDYTLLRSAPNSWVIGTAYKNWSVRDEGNHGAYAWARVGGSLRHCVWIYRKATTTKDGRIVSGSCGEPRKYQGSTFKKLFTNGMIGSSNNGRDGAPIRLQPHGACVVNSGKIDGFGNVQPWRAHTMPSDVLPGALALGTDGVTTTGKNLVKWRYVTRDGRYAMVHATRYGTNDGRGHQGWFFISRDCLPL